jgi:purine-binding chemotaxis protein CheW
MKSHATPAFDESTARRTWDQLHRRLEAAKAALERGFTPTPVEQRQRLRERALALARVPAPETAPQESLAIVEFLLASEKYGVAAAYVREIHPLRDYTPLPCTPQFVLGIMNVRGQLLSVLDLKKFFDLPHRGVTALNKVIIVHNDQMEFGILTDATLGVRTIPLQDIQPALPTLTGVRAEYVQGITEEPVAILDAQKLLSDKKLIVHDEVEMALD